MTWNLFNILDSQDGGEWECVSSKCVRLLDGVWRSDTGCDSLWRWTLPDCPRHWCWPWLTRPSPLHQTVSAPADSLWAEWHSLFEEVQTLTWHQWALYFQSEVELTCWRWARWRFQSAGWGAKWSGRLAHWHWRCDMSTKVRDVSRTRTECGHLVDFGLGAGLIICLVTNFLLHLTVLLNPSSLILCFTSKSCLSSSSSLPLLPISFYPFFFLSSNFNYFFPSAVHPLFLALLP